MDTKIWALIGAGVIVVLGGWFVFSGGDDATGGLDTGAEVEESETTDADDDS